MYWGLSDEEKENIFRQKITSNFKVAKNCMKEITKLKQQVEELSSGVNIQELERHHKSLKVEKDRLFDLAEQYEEQEHYWHKRQSCQKDLEEKCSSLKQKVETLQKTESKWKKEIDEMKSKQGDRVKMKDELKQMKSNVKTLTQKNKELQQKAEKLRKKMSGQDQLSDKLRTEKEKYTELLRKCLQETTEQLCKTEGNKKQCKTVGTQTAQDIYKIEAEDKENIGKISEALSQLTEANKKEKELLQQTSTLQEQLASVKAELESVKANSGGPKESDLVKEIEGLKKQLEEARRDLRHKSDTMTRSISTYKKKLIALKADLPLSATQVEIKPQTGVTPESEIKSLRSRLAEAANEVKLEVRTETEKAPPEDEVYQLKLQLTERGSQLETMQQEKDQADVTIKELETSLHAEREQVSQAKASEKAMQEQLTQLQGERMLLLQKLEEAKNHGNAKEHALTPAEQQCREVLLKVREDRVHLMEGRNKELTTMVADLKNEIFKLERERIEADFEFKQEMIERDCKLKREKIERDCKLKKEMIERHFKAERQKIERDTNLRLQQQQKLLDSFKKPSVSKAAQYVCMSHTNEKEGHTESLNEQNLQRAVVNKSKELEQRNCVVINSEVQPKNEAPPPPPYSQLEDQPASTMSSSVSNVKEAKAEQEVPSVQLIQVCPAPSARQLPAAETSPKSSSVSNVKEAEAEQEVPSVQLIQVCPAPSARQLPAARRKRVHFECVTKNDDFVPRRPMKR